MNPLLFGYLAAAIIVFSALAVTRKNPVHAILFMIVMFFHLAVMYLGLDAEFLAAIQIIVYAGAILVLFLFVVMVLNIKEEMSGERFSSGWPLGISLAAGIFLLAIIMTGNVFPLGQQGIYTPALIASETHTKALGSLMYTQYIFPFELASLILLVAVIGAIVLAKKRLR
ncbi:MAG: NADH-quinone oxidoreductase subunit J [Nitrospiraceae bacterium]|nr:NADH-quinone oxidoreductase subunit J [Nitrospiraceae bacterium]